MFDQINNWVSDQLVISSGPSAFLFLFLGGVLASLMPCVYPVYPLTVNYLRNRKSDMGKFAHPLTYYAGLAAIYFGFGIIAALTGGAFNQVLQLPLSNLSIGLLLFVMALSTLDLLQLPLFGGEVESEKSGLGGTFIIGAGAGLLSSACVGPIVVSILIAIASGASEISLGLTLGAAFKMMLFGMGVGIPVLLLGVFGMALPKSGKWMLSVQWIFAMLIGYFAIGFLVKGLNGLGFNDQVASYITFGAIVFVLAIYQIQSVQKTKQEKTKIALYSLLGVVGFLTMASNVLPSQTVMGSNLAVSNSVSENIEQKGDLLWYLNKEAAYAKAGETGKLVFVDFHADWCTNCKAFQEKTQKNVELNSALQNAVLYKVYDTSPEFDKYRNDPRYPELQIGIPFFLITDASGDVLYKTNDFTRTEDMILFLE
ncbi:protein-disulfide reductase DsbD family protein [Aquiflexum sp.]|uniref:protein-disulfide reductase DsbD family protein n=1 Tax=Aquiflexum sp. TaxID=1872584 RepID=UPI0035941793